MSTQPSTQSTSEAEYSPKEIYHAVLRCVDHNTGHVQAPLCPQSSIVLSLASHGRFSADAVKRAINAAVGNGDLCRCRDRDGRRRLGPNDPDRLLEKISTHTDRRSSPNEEMIEIANYRIGMLKGRD